MFSALSLSLAGVQLQGVTHQMVIARWWSHQYAELIYVDESTTFCEIGS